ncbi:hypothetical protein EUX98_g629 [Antrodiella citrinella]|uniref:XPG-I domain-containing protein n=1 Tax=Antrodiella citrinella TaxID=2447956 RepID=A0A4S4N4Z5_9APHY|nr:hypothetical protein EUX98_g629 [Antrodiella citrinella]
MGVQGLWEVIGPAGKSRSLANLAVVEGFEGNASGRRAFKLGIDASLWYQHASACKGGVNPEIRLLYFRLLNLMELPILPLFMFDGRERPRVKRGSKLGKTGSHLLNKKMKEMLNIFGMEWREAKGEAEAELAFLNKEGFIDAVLTDDVDVLVFGAKMMIRNTSLKLTGNKAHPALNADGKESKSHTMIFTADDIRNHPDIGLTRNGMILFALLCGGDYDTGGTRGFGRMIAHGLARCGFGDQLIQAYEHAQGGNMQQVLAQWRADVNNEIQTNASGFLGRRSNGLTLPPDFPNIEILKNYLHPAVREGGGQMRDRGNFSISRAATFWENHFDELGTKFTTLKRFRTLVWEGAIVQLLRRAALEADEKERLKRERNGEIVQTICGPLRPRSHEGVGTHLSLVKKYLDSAPQNPLDRIAGAFVNQGNGHPVAGPSSERAFDLNPLVEEIVGYREHVSTDHLPQYRVKIMPCHLVKLATSGIKGRFPDSQASQTQKKLEETPTDPMRLWLPASMIRQVHPCLVEDYEVAQAAKKTGKGKGKQRAVTDDESDVEIPPSTQRRSSQSQAKPRASQAQARQSHVEASDVAGSTVPRPRPRPVPRKTIEIPDSVEEIPSSSMSQQMPRLKARELAEAPIEYTLPMRACGFIFTFPDPDNPGDVIWGDDTNRLDDAIPSVSNLMPMYQDLRSRPDLPPSSQNAAASRSVNGVASSSRLSPKRKRTTARGDSSDDGSQNERDPTDMERMLDKILGFGPATSKKRKGAPKAARKRARPVTEDLGVQGDRDAPAAKRRKAPTKKAGQTEAASTNAPTSSLPPKRKKTAAVASSSQASDHVVSMSRVASQSARAFPILPELDDPFDRSVSVRSASLTTARRAEAIDISDEDEDVNFQVPKVVQDHPPPSVSDRERLNYPDVSSLDLDDDPRSSYDQQSIRPSVRDFHDSESEEELDDEEQSEERRVSNYGPKMTVHSRAPWELGEEDEAPRSRKKKEKGGDKSSKAVDGKRFRDLTRQVVYPSLTLKNSF